MARVTRRSLDARGFSIIEALVSCAIIAVLAALGLPAYMNALEAAKIARAIGDIRAIDRDIQIQRTLTGCLPGSLVDINQDFRRDPWGRPYVYNVLSGGGGSTGGSGNGSGNGNGKGNTNGSGNGSGIAVTSACAACNGACINKGQARKDHSLVPINSDFDLFSIGRDGQSAGALTAAASQDDIVRASDGAFVGLGRDY